MEFPSPWLGVEGSRSLTLSTRNVPTVFLTGAYFCSLFPLSPGRRGGCKNFLCVPTLYVGQSSRFHAQQVLPVGFWVGSKEVKQPLRGGVERRVECRKDDGSLYFLSHRTLNPK